MWPFTKKYTLLDTAVFRGWTDRHSHILPGVDDGIRTMSDALAVLRYYEQLGVSTLWLTPHVMEDCPNEPARLRERFRELQAAYAMERKTEGRQTTAVSLHLSAENMIDSLFVKRLEAGEILPYGDNGDELLVETSYVQPPYQFKNILKDIQQAGYYPVLAHPERYRYMGYEDYEKFHKQGIRFQMNISSLAGGYGPNAKERAEFLLEEGFYKYQGSDLHALSSFQHITEAKTLKKDIKALLSPSSL